MEWNVSLLSNGTSSRPFGLFFFFLLFFLTFEGNERTFPEGEKKALVTAGGCEYRLPLRADAGVR